VSEYAYIEEENLDSPYDVGVPAEAVVETEEEVPEAE